MTSVPPAIQAALFLRFGGDPLAAAPSSISQKPRNSDETFRFVITAIVFLPD